MKASGILFDIDGVLAHGGSPIDGAVDVLAWLTRRRIPYRLVTNTTRKSRRLVVDSLAASGLSVPPEQIMTPIIAAAGILKERKWRATYLVDERALEDLPSEAARNQADAVLIGDLGEKFNYDVLNRAFQSLKQGAVLLAAHKNRFWMKDTEPLLDAGPFVAALEYGAEIKAELIGKPARPFFEAAVRSLYEGRAQLGPTVMIGDRWDADVEGARAAGLLGLLVRTGTYEEGDDQKGSPDGVLDSVADLPRWLAG